MTTADFTTTILVDQSPAQAYDAINNVRGWWSEEVQGSTDQLNEAFDYHFEDIHRCRIKVTELIPGRKVAWLVTENYFKPGIFGDTPHDGFANDATEWTGTEIVFDISEQDGKTLVRFTHRGLTPAYECYDACSSGWTHYIRESLHSLITTGQGQPNATGTPRTSEEEQFRTVEVR